MHNLLQFSHQWSLFFYELEKGQRFYKSHVWIVYAIKQQEQHQQQHQQKNSFIYFMCSCPSPASLPDSPHGSSLRFQAPPSPRRPAPPPAPDDPQAVPAHHSLPDGSLAGDVLGLVGGDNSSSLVRLGTLAHWAVCVLRLTDGGGRGFIIPDLRKSVGFNKTVDI